MKNTTLIMDKDKPSQTYHFNKKSCDSKLQHKTISSVEYVIANDNSGTCQDYYKCEVCGFYHVYTINKSVSDKRNVANNKKFFKQFKKTKYRDGYIKGQRKKK